MSLAKRSFVALFAALFLPSALAFSAEDRPSAPKLLPENTLAYVRINDTPELIEKFNETSMGKIGQNEQIRALAGQLYGAAGEAFQQVEDQVGLSLDSLLELPQGEVCFAVVPPKTGTPAFVLIVDVGKSAASARKLLARGEAAAREGGARINELRIGNTELKVFEGLPDGITPAYFERDKTIVISSHVAIAEQIVRRWDGDAEEDDKTLAENRDFITVLNRSKGTKDERPQITFFVNPIELVRVSTRGNFGAQAGLALLPALGLDGFKGVGGSMIFAPEDFDAIVHIHVLLDSPRAGVLKLAAFKSGDTTPEPFIPNNIVSYMTFNLDANKILTEGKDLYDSFYEEGEFEKLIKTNMSDNMGIDFNEDILEQLDGRLTWATWMVPPARINSQANLVAMKIKDTKKFKKTIEKIIDHTDAPAERKVMGGIVYYQTEPRIQRPVGPGPMVRQPSPAIAIIGDFVVFSDSVEFLRHAIQTKGKANQQLANNPEFNLIASKIKRQLGDNEAGMISFNRPEETFRLFYDLATGEESRGALAQMSEENEFFGAVNSALNDNPLPPFSELTKHLAPGGGALTSDETGFHYTAFSLKRE